MSLGTKEIVAIAIASTFATIAVATGGAAIGSEVKYGTLNFPKAMSVTKQFNSFAESNRGKELSGDKNFQEVQKFVKNPSGTKLVATPTEDKNGIKWRFECYSKEDWSKLKKDDKNIKVCKYDFDAVPLYLQDAEKQSKPAEEKDEAQKGKKDGGKEGDPTPEQGGAAPAATPTPAETTTTEQGAAATPTPAETTTPEQGAAATPTTTTASGQGEEDKREKEKKEEVPEQQPQGQGGVAAGDATTTGGTAATPTPSRNHNHRTRSSSASSNPNHNHSRRGM